MAIIITGCSRGLGFQLLGHFASKGKSIIACVRKDTPLLRESIKDWSTHVKVIECDLESEDIFSIVTKTLEEQNEEIEGLINNAGISITKSVFSVEYDDLKKSFNTNYFAPVLMIKSVAQFMARQGYGSIVNISSMMSEGHQPGGSCYDASKAALNQMTRSVAQELAPFNVRVNAIACGIMDTDMYHNLSDKEKNKLNKTIALKRIASPNEIVEMVDFLLSDKASYITGQIIHVDGGAII